MLDVLIRSTLDIVGRTERLIETTKRQLHDGGLDEIELYELDCEMERLRNVLFAADEAIRSLAYKAERLPQTAGEYGLHTTLH
ncbi:hypothetical protein NE852_29145 (plasmid) [Rhizobium sp. Pop5]|uniref:hypothetical protein n=1 Tax=Rhizobium sp. Pop5 TaxID=1223565 RepID=UPI00028373C9|nr:hypothetical protein [Rhizobium sp. Pop5]EJZ18841.1 hypothetical protein RCCGEPOP_23407 [Rhizobium sp. Pop5]UVD60649.1 hypothetical protein NE852_29145 [Rhizobium sp. Pop5]